MTPTELASQEADDQAWLGDAEAMQMKSCGVKSML
jgi:hypothetical protein